MCFFFLFAAMSPFFATAGVLRSHSLVHCSSDFNDHELGSSVCFGWRETGRSGCTQWTDATTRFPLCQVGSVRCGLMKRLFKAKTKIGRKSWKHRETVKRCFDELWDAGFKLKDLCALEDTIHDTQKISFASWFRINDKIVVNRQLEHDLPKCCNFGQWSNMLGFNCIQLVLTCLNGVWRPFASQGFLKGGTSLINAAARALSC